MFVCVSGCTCVWGVRVHVCTHACGGQKTTLYVIPQVLFTLDFDTWSLLVLELGELY